jgi:hypothetical protein
MRPASKIALWLLVCMLLAAVLYWLYRPRVPNRFDNQFDAAPASAAAANSEQPSNPTAVGNSPAAPPSSAAAALSATPAPFANTNPPPPITPYVLGSAATPPPMDPSIVLGNLRNVIANYGSRYGGNPVGNNAEITAALNGGNTNGAIFLTEESGLRINGQGELVDYWGTPFFLHQVSGTQMEIRSAGPDKKMWTADDLVTK